MIMPVMRRIKNELHCQADEHTNHILCSLIEVLLRYCQRFYDRQFNNRSAASNTDILRRLELMVGEYLASPDVVRYGIPNVTWAAEQFHLSPNYFGDLIKRLTGITAQEHIQNLLIQRAKTVLHTSDKTVSEIAYDMGFKYPNHLSRMFKKNVGVTPHQYRLRSPQKTESTINV